MTAHLRKWLTGMGDVFWLLPGLMVLAGTRLAIALVHADKSGSVPDALLGSQLLYDGAEQELAHCSARSWLPLSE